MLNDIHMCSELEVGQILRCRILKGRLGGKGHQYRSLARLTHSCGANLALAVQQKFELEL